jgi:hypothetical protein
MPQFWGLLKINDRLEKRFVKRLIPIKPSAAEKAAAVFIQCG